MYFASVSVAESHRRCGVGRRMLTYAMQEGAEATHFALHVRASNDPAQRLYGRHGFTIKNRVYGYYGDEDAFYMTAPNPH
jgi:ribosomal protein S18 acetylase RimI-like enzyme